MTKLSKRLPADNEKLAQLVREFVQGLLARITWYYNIMAGSKDNSEREFYRTYRKLPKVQLPVAQIGRTHNHIVFQHCRMPLDGGLEFINADAAVPAATIKKNLEGLGV